MREVSTFFSSESVNLFEMYYIELMFKLEFRTDSENHYKNYSISLMLLFIRQ